MLRFRPVAYSKLAGLDKKLLLVVLLLNLLLVQLALMLDSHAGAVLDTIKHF